MDDEGLFHLSSGVLFFFFNLSWVEHIPQSLATGVPYSKVLGDLRTGKELS